MSSKVFISWSGELSKKIAEQLKNWLPSVLQFVKPYFTPDDIEKGSRWSNEISNELASSNVGIICLTPDNISNPWILFESGAISKNFGKSNVCTLLFNLDPIDLSGPLTNFQATRFEKEDFKKLIVTINNTDKESQLTSDVLNGVFEKWWPDLEERIKNIVQEEKVVHAHKKRSDREILEEVLELARLNTERGATPFPKNIDSMIEYLIKCINDLSQINLNKYGDKELQRTLKKIKTVISDICFEFGMPNLVKYIEIDTEQRKIVVVKKKADGDIPF
ncbi:hypothetical protein AGMMS50267_04920 [Spirochaetia bacterium]|nr:hypothetical protein AGMMS50267_04920 [Spirochaetia bacterium]